ncbi:protein HIDE1 isoform X1 [Artibeus jamaicensis]|uniref:protein HIDE1 isoform X1 n=1 Tax=Artibeus jamaicensis TaxID=9417 RepID=UPI00235ADD2D|nr:protein HIDE1 isoform X1 [Artibeus jamaicensis]
MPWTVLLLAAGSMAIPAPSILLVPPHPSSHEDPIYIGCMAPMGFPGANFTLYRGEMVVQLLQAPADQLGVIFNLSGGTWEAAGGTTFHCQYGVLGEDRLPQLSDRSDTVHVSFPVPPWILALSLSLAGALLLAGLVAVAVVIRKGNSRRREQAWPTGCQSATPGAFKVRKMQKKREQESCWAQINFTTTDMSFNNSLFAISTKMTSEGDTVTLYAYSGSAATPENCGPRKRPTSTSSSPEPPEFSTFRACQ